MPYTKTTFVSGAAPGISAAELNKIQQGIEDAHLALGGLSIRKNPAGYVEYDDGTGWKPVAASKMYLASNTYREGFPEERVMSANGAATLIYKFLPKQSGELIVKTDLLYGGSTGSIDVIAFVGSNVAATDGLDVWDAANGPNWRMPIGSQGMGTSPTGAVTIMTTVSLSWTTLERTLSVTVGVPVYFFIRGGNQVMKVRNFGLYYDEVIL